MGMQIASEFLGFLGSYPADWAMLFVEAPMDATSQAYEHYLEKPLHQDVDVESPHDSGLCFPQYIVCEILDCDWIMVLHGGAEHGIPLLSGFRHRVLELSGSEGDQIHCCNLCIPFESSIKFRTKRTLDDDAEIYDCTGEPQPHDENLRRVASYVEVLNSLGIRPVILGRSTDGGVAAPPESMDRIVRVDAADIDRST